MFIDKAKVTLRAGKGGDGKISFRREKYVPRGGPDGGNGGRGGSIYFVATTNMSTLRDFRYKKIISAPNGENGGTNDMYGKKGEAIYINSPVGSVVYLEPEHIMIADFTSDKQTLLMAKGGRGGRGNAAFRTSQRKAPRIAENGIKGEEKTLSIELKLLADVGLVGLPNVGKSTFLNVVSNAKPEIADYPFTTLMPELGLVTAKDGRQFVIADLPGLIEGASLGKGLGIEFLQHIERCRVLAVFLDFENDEKPFETYKLLLNELEAYNPKLLKLPRIIIAAKFEDEEASKKLKELSKLVEENIYPLSSLLHLGIDEILTELANILDATPVVSLISEESDETASYKVYKEEGEVEPPFIVTKISDHEYRITGKKVLERYYRYNLSSDEALLHLLAYLREIGVDDYLDNLGLEDGDLVYLEDFTFEYYR